VNACICSAGGQELDRRLRHQLKAFLDYRLNGQLVFLPLPPMVSGTVVCEHKPDVSKRHLFSKKKEPETDSFFDRLNMGLKLTL
jgi:hypothetical protein